MKNNDILKYSKIDAIKNIKHFLNLIELNPDAFEHLYNIEISIRDFENPRELALYYHDSNEILISRQYIERTKDKLKDKDKIISEISSSITHEILHSNRSVSICSYNDYFQGMPFNINNKQTDLEEKNPENALEEIVTETTNIIIQLNKDKEVFNIDKTLNELQKYARSNNKILVEAGYLLMKEYKEKLIYSFILSSYDEIYRNEIMNEISSNKDLLSNISDLYYEYVDANKRDRDILNKIKSNIIQSR